MIEVMKRNGDIVAFDKLKIEEAIQKASKRTEEIIPYTTINAVIDNIVKENKDCFDVEDLQEIVETTLMQKKHYKTAQEYIRYRNWRNDQRKIQSQQTKFIQDVIDLKNLENENANMNEHLFTAKKERIVSNVLKDYADKYLISKDVLDAFKNNLIYIHDYSTYALGMHNCTTIDLLDILSRGFKTQNGNVRPPTSVRSAGQLTAVILQCVSNEQFGGVAVGALDYALAPYIEMSFQKWLEKASMFEKIEKPITILETFNEDFEKMNDIEKRVMSFAYKETDKETYQSCEALIHNLNTLTSRSGNQLPFTSVNFGTDTSVAGRMLSRNFMLSRQAGVGENHTTPIFPIGVFKYKKGVNAKPSDPNYDLKQLAIQTTSKRIYPNFANVDAPHLEKPISGHPETEFCTMG